MFSLFHFLQYCWPKGQNEGNTYKNFKKCFVATKIAVSVLVVIKIDFKILGNY